MDPLGIAWDGSCLQAMRFISKLLTCRAANEAALRWRARLYSPPDVLILDEPTNDLDIPSREALEGALGQFGGTVILISHDRYLIDHLATEVWSLEPTMEGQAIASSPGGDRQNPSGRSPNWSTPPHEQSCNLRRWVA